MAVGSWDEFVKWASNFYELPSFEANEREFKITIADHIRSAQRAFETGSPDWLELLKKAFGPPNNLTHFILNSKFLEWVVANPAPAKEALHAIWSGRETERIEEFLGFLPAAAVGGAGSRLSLATFLRLGLDEATLPFYKPRPVKLAYGLAHYEPPPASSGDVARYEHFVAFLDAFIAESHARGLDLRDRLDAQGLVWTVTRWDPPDAWTPDQQAALLQFRGGNQTSREEIREFIEEAPYSRVWWVNQGRSWRRESEGGYLASPKASIDGVVPQAYRNMTLLEKGDVVLHYAQSKVVGVSRVTGTVADGAARQDWPAGHPNPDGYTIPVSVTKLKRPLRLEDIPVTWRKVAGAPFQSDGRVQSRYLFELTQGLLDGILGDPAGGAVKPYAGEPPFAEILDRVRAAGLSIDERALRRYHLSLKTRGFVILAGLSGSGKTWLAQAYAEAVEATQLVVPVAPNWTTNEDLIGYFNPMVEKYYHTEFSRFLESAASEYDAAETEGRAPHPFHLILDEMNLARVEYYFAKFLSAMEVRAREGRGNIELSADDNVALTPNLYFIGTVNNDETTQGFADKVFDRAQLIEMTISRSEVEAHLAARPYATILIQVWDCVRDVAPFAFRVLNEIDAYVVAADAIGRPWEEALDEQILQKVLPKLKGADPRLGKSLSSLTQLFAAGPFVLSRAKVADMTQRMLDFGFTSYF